MPALSPNGRLLAYVTDADKTYPPNTPVRDTKPRPEVIVVGNLQTGRVHRWAFTSSMPGIDSVSWSPNSRFLSYSSLYWGKALHGQMQVTQLLDIREGGTLTSARRIPLAHGLAWAGFLTPRVGVAVEPYPAAQGRQQSLVAVAVGSGRVLRRLVRLPRSGLAVGNAFDGTEGTITGDPTGHFLLIAAEGPRGTGELFRWTAGTPRLVRVAYGVLHAVWA
jgi:hypothetical protein